MFACKLHLHTELLFLLQGQFWFEIVWTQLNRLYFTNGKHFTSCSHKNDKSLQTVKLFEDWFFFFCLLVNYYINFLSIKSRTSSFRHCFCTRSAWSNTWAAAWMRITLFSPQLLKVLLKKINKADFSGKQVSVQFSLLTLKLEESKHLVLHQNGSLCTLKIPPTMTWVSV